MSGFQNSQHIQLEVHQHLATLTLARADKLNSLTPDMLQTLSFHLDRIERDTTIRAVLIRAEGDKAFCVGADIHAWADLHPLDMWRQWVSQGHRIFDRLVALRQPVICVVNGLALGGGLELAASADVRIASASAKFALPEATVATCPGWSGSQRLVRELTPGWVKAMALFGQWWTADDALQNGFVQAVCDTPSAAEMEAKRWAHKAIDAAPVSVQLNKQLINAAMGIQTDSTLEAMASAVAGFTQDAIEGKDSFFEKRPASFQGK